MLPALDDLLALLDRWPEVVQVQIFEYELDAGAVALIKLRGKLPHGHSVQIRLRLEASAIRYSYQLFSKKPVIRWDNAPHHPGVATSPHHFHDDTDVVHPSTLSGDPLVDLPTVLIEMLAACRRGALE